MDIEAIYETLNSILSPWFMVGVGLVQFALAYAVGRRWRMVTLAPVGLSGVFIAVVYTLFGLDILTEFLVIRVAGRLAIASLILSNIAFLGEALWQAIQRAGNGGK